MRSLPILVPLLLILMVAANGALTVLPRSITGPGLAMWVSHSFGIGVVDAQAEEPPHASGKQALLWGSDFSPSAEELDVIGAMTASVFEPAAPVVEPGAARSSLLTSGSFSLAVPFRTQKDGDRFQGSNCGPAALAMVLDAFGIQQTNSELRFRAHTYQGTVGYRGGTALQHVASVGRDFGVQPLGLYSGSGGSSSASSSSPSFRRWSIDDVRAQLAEGNPVVPLVKYRLLPGHESSTTRFDHYIVIYGQDGDEFLYHDPAFETARAGAALRMSAARLQTAMQASIVSGQAVAFGAGTHEALAAWTV